MAEPVNSTATLASITALAMLPGIDVAVLLGSFAGAAVFALSSDKLPSPWRCSTIRAAAAVTGRELDYWLSTDRRRCCWHSLSYAAMWRRSAHTTLRRQTSGPLPNLLKRQFDMSKPNKVWVADITYIRMYEGWLYLAVVLDLFSHQIVGWSTKSQMTSDFDRQPDVACRHEARIASTSSNICRYSDSFESRCGDISKLQIIFTMNYCDREIMGWAADTMGSAMNI